MFLRCTLQHSRRFTISTAGELPVAPVFLLEITAVDAEARLHEMSYVALLQGADETGQLLTPCQDADQADSDQQQHRKLYFAPSYYASSPPNDLGNHIMPQQTLISSPSAAETRQAVELAPAGPTYLITAPANCQDPFVPIYDLSKIPMSYVPTPTAASSSIATLTPPQPAVAPAVSMQQAPGPPSFQQYRQPPHTTAQLVATGDQLLRECQEPSFVKAVRSGKYGLHKPLLRRIWDHIQSVQLLPPAAAGTSAAGISSSSVPEHACCVQKVPYSLPDPAIATTSSPSAAAAAGEGGGGGQTLIHQQFLLVPPPTRGSGSSPPAAAAARAPVADQGVGGVARSFTGYTSATPRAIDDSNSRFLVSVTQGLSETYPGWGFRLWVCAVKQDQQQLQQRQQRQQPPVVQQPQPQPVAAADLPPVNQVQMPASSYGFHVNNDSMLTDAQDLEDLHEFLTEFAPDLTKPAAAAAEPAEQAAEPAAAAAAVPAAGTGALDAAASGAGSSSGLSAAWPHNSSHTVVGVVNYSRGRAAKARAQSKAAAGDTPPATATAAATGRCRKKPKPQSNAVAAAQPAESPAAAGDDLACQSYLLDLSVGWCVFEYTTPKVPKQKGSATAGDQGGQQQAVKRSRSSSVDMSAPAPAAATSQPAAVSSGPSSSLGMHGLQLTSDVTTLTSVDSEGAGSGTARSAPLPAAQGTEAAAVAAADKDLGLESRTHTSAAALDDLTHRIQLLNFQASGWTPNRLLSFFQPGSTGAAAPLDAATVSQIQDALLQQDVRDNYKRNVLHLLASYNPGRSPILNADQIVQQQLDILLSHPELLQKLQHQVNNNGATPLMVAATFAVPGVYDRLLRVATLDVFQATTKSGWTLFHRLAQSAAAAADPSDRKRFQDLLPATIQRVIDVAFSYYDAASRSAATQQQQQQQQMLLQGSIDLVWRILHMPEPDSRHYQGHEVMRQVQERARTLLAAKQQQLGMYRQ